MKTVFYSLLTNNQENDGMRCMQLTTSIRSIRNHNKTIPIRLHLFGTLPAETACLLQDMSVEIVEFPSYKELIDDQIPGLGDWLEKYPVMHKFLTMYSLSDDYQDQVLYLDSDTYIHGDIESLFVNHSELDLYAREEHGSKRSHLGYQKNYLDEDRLYEIAELESCQRIFPFNSGVVLYNNGVWKRLLEFSQDYLKFVARLSMWMEARGFGIYEHPDIYYLRRHKSNLASYLKDLKPMQFPGSNYWIKEEMALWLAVGKINDIKIGCFDKKYVLQGCEEMLKEVTFAKPIISHYYSNNTQYFLDRVNTQIYKD